MFNSERLLHIAIVITVSLSGLLLGLGQRDLTTTAIAVIGAIVAFLITEVFRLFRFDQWFANMAAILVTAFALVSFGGGDRVYQLIVVANLLVYLQTILLFQKKTPRLYWQVLVLSLLQVVVAAVFNLGFEGGMLFILYMIISGGTTMLLHLHQDAWSIRQRNSEIRQKLASRRDSEEESRTIWFDPHPIAIYDDENRDHSVLRRQLKHYSWFGFAAFVFALLMFTIIPRDSEAWSGPKSTEAIKTGGSKFVNLNFSGVIQLTDDHVMRVTFRDPKTNQNVQLNKEPYLRGLPLGILSRKEGSTTWLAPYESVNSGSIDTPVDGFAYRNLFSEENFLLQTIVLEPTSDPLLYAVSPYFRHGKTLTDVKYNTTLSCLTRDAKRFPNTTFEYTLGVGDFRNLGGIDDFIPHGLYQDDVDRISGTRKQFYLESLLELNNAAVNYPFITRKAEELSGRAINRDLTDFEIAKRLERHFLQPASYVYTLDLGSFKRQPNMDPVEDFVKNHHSGHCEYFASALTIMLRSQGIPARLVVGYHGGDYNKFGDYYDVQNKHAHAWVEAYIQPDHVPLEIANKSPHAKRFGMWQRLDPTPASDLDTNDFLSNAGDAFGYARSFWNDYVLGMTGEGEDIFRSDYNSSYLSIFNNLLNVETWSARANSFRDSLSDPASPAYYLRFLIPGLMFFFGYRQWKKRRKMSPEQKRKNDRQSSIRQFLGKTLRLVSPKLGDWVAGVEPVRKIEVPFYENMSRLLNRYSFKRDDKQTQKEFALNVSNTFQDSPQQQKIEQLLSHLTDLFYQVRFGGRTLQNQEEIDAEKSIGELELLLAASSRAG